MCRRAARAGLSCAKFFPRIEHLRVDHDLTQIAVGEFLNLNREVYRRYEQGIREIPVWAVIKLADYYHTSVDYILGRTDNQSQPHA